MSWEEAEGRGLSHAHFPQAEGQRGRRASYVCVMGITSFSSGIGEINLRSDERKFQQNYAPEYKQAALEQLLR